MLLVAVDVGGTHTDLFAWSEAGAVREKVPSTPTDPADGVLDALTAADLHVPDVDHFLHGSTITTNALIEGTYPKTAFVTTEGFRDLLEIGRYHREKLYDPYQRKPEPLVPRRHRFTVPERLDADGAVVTPLDEAAVDALVADLDAGGFAAVAIGFVNAYANGEHEERVAARLREELDAYVATSSAVAPKLGTLNRFTTTVVNAALSPIIGEYTDDLRERLAAAGFEGTFSVIKSNGGVMEAARTWERAETTVLSGPAAGARGAGFVGDLAEKSDVIGMDMGGTSTDISLVEDGDPLTTTQYEIRFDVPLAVPMVDVNTIGSGGGTIAWVDDGGSLRVGPQSAGADPGPACYPGGGDRPTITDANLVLGRLDPEYFLGGEMRLDADAAHDAVAALAAEIGLSPVECATGVVRIANENMAAAIRETTIERGRDPRDYYLVGFGGCGPMHAVAVAESLGVPTVVVPPDPGVLSAFAGTMMDVQYDEETTFFAPAATVDRAALNEAFAGLDAAARAHFDGEGVAGDIVSLERVAEMRYVGQTYELDVPVPNGDLDAAALDEVRGAFHRVHEVEYGVANRAFDVEFVNLRVRASASYTDAEVRPATATVTDGAGVGGDRSAFFDGEWRETTVLDRRRLRAGDVVAGPAIVEDETATTVVDPGAVAELDDHGNLVVDVSGGERR